MIEYILGFFALLIVIWVVIAGFKLIKMFWKPALLIFVIIGVFSLVWKWIKGKYGS